MTEFTVEFAGVPVAVQAQFAATRQFCRDYLTQREPELRISVTQEDLLAERESVKQLETFQNPSMRFLETLVLHRKLAEQLVGLSVLGKTKHIESKTSECVYIVSASSKVVCDVFFLHLVGVQQSLVHFLQLTVGLCQLLVGGVELLVSGIELEIGASQLATRGR